MLTSIIAVSKDQDEVTSKLDDMREKRMDKLHTYTHTYIHTHTHTHTHTHIDYCMNSLTLIYCKTNLKTFQNNNVHTMFPTYMNIQKYRNDVLKKMEKIKKIRKKEIRLTFFSATIQLFSLINYQIGLPLQNEVFCVVTYVQFHPYLQCTSDPLPHSQNLEPVGK